MNEIALATNIPQIRKKMPFLDMIYVSVEEYKARQAKYLRSEYARLARKSPSRISQLQEELEDILEDIEEECRSKKTIRVPRYLRKLWTESEKYPHAFELGLL